VGNSKPWLRKTKMLFVFEQECNLMMLYDNNWQTLVVVIQVAFRDLSLGQNLFRGEKLVD